MEQRKITVCTTQLGCRTVGFRIKFYFQNINQDKTQNLHYSGVQYPILNGKMRIKEIQEAQQGSKALFPLWSWVDYSWPLEILINNSLTYLCLFEVVINYMCTLYMQTTEEWIFCISRSFIQFTVFIDFWRHSQESMTEHILIKKETDGKNSLLTVLTGLKLHG